MPIPFFPFPVPEPPTTKPIKIITPIQGSKITGGATGVLVGTMTEESFFQKVKKAVWIVRDSCGNVVGGPFTVPFVNGSTSIAYTYPDVIGSYSVELKVLGGMKYVNVIDTVSFEIDKNKQLDLGSV